MRTAALLSLTLVLLVGVACRPNEDDAARGPSPSPVATPSPTPQPCTEEAAFRRVRPGVVRVIVDTGTGWQPGGTGYVVTPAGQMITNNHVVDKARRVAVIPASGTQTVVQVARRDAKRDLALLEPGALKLEPLTFAVEANISPGQRVLALGYPRSSEIGGGSPTLTNGIVSAVRDSDGVRYVQTDTPLNPGNSGGPLFNLCGEVLGTVVFGLTDAQGLNFAVAIREMRAFLDAPSPSPSATPGRSPLPSATPARSPLPTGSPGRSPLPTVTPGRTPTPAPSRSPAATSSPGARDAAPDRERAPLPLVSPSPLFPFPFASPTPLFPFPFASPTPRLVLPSLGPLPTFQPRSDSGSTWTGFFTPAPVPAVMGEPEEVLRQFYTYLNRRQHADAYRLLSRRFQTREPFELWRSGYATTTQIRIDAVWSTGRSPATAAIEFGAVETDHGMPRLQRYRCEYELVADGGSWLIDGGDCRRAP